jgi:hypothetical protein
LKSFVFIFFILINVSFSSELPILNHSKESGHLTPVTYYFNSAFDVTQNPYYFSQSDFLEKHKTLFRRIRSPHNSIKRDGGYSKLFKDEFLTSRVVPNLGLHMIGGAYDKLFLYQFFEEKDYPAPMLFTAVLSYMGHFGNEALELTNSNISSHDNIADLFFFDVVSFYLAFNPKVMNFLVNDLEMHTWHSQPMYLVKDSDITNAGLNYIFRPDLFKNKFRPFLFMGMQNLAGLSYEFKQDHFFTTAFGMALTDPLEQKGKFVTAFFYDKKDFLASSLYINGTEDFRVRLNLFPELFNFEKLRFGFLLGQKKNREEVVGINLNLPLGLAFSN